MQSLVDLPVAIIGDVPEFFVDGIARIEEIDGCLRFTLFAYVFDDEILRRAEVVITTPIHAVARQAMQASTAAEAAIVWTIH